MPAMKAVHDTDPRKEIMKKVKDDLRELELFGNNILVAVYQRPKEAQYGKLKLHLADSTRDEDKHQGKVGLVLKLGPRAFQDDDEFDFHGQSVEVGDWIVYRPSEGWQLTLTDNQVLCRMLTEGSIRMRIPSPDMVW